MRQRCLCLISAISVTNIHCNIFPTSVKKYLAKIVYFLCKIFENPVSICYKIVKIVNSFEISFVQLSYSPTISVPQKNMLPVLF